MSHRVFQKFPARKASEEYISQGKIHLQDNQYRERVSDDLVQILKDFEDFERFRKMLQVSK